MKKALLPIGIMVLLASPAMADPGAFFGITYNFSGSVGLSLKVLSNNKEDRGVVGAGVSYFPMTNKFGLDASAGYLFQNGEVTAGWDFLQNSPQVGIGFVNTKSSSNNPPPPPPPDD